MSCNSFKPTTEEKSKLSKSQKEKMKLEKEIKMLEFYFTRYIEHVKAIKFAIKKKLEIKKAIETCLEMSSRYGPKDYQFLEDIADLVIRTRSAIAHTYVTRFYLRGSSKKRFFDFI